MFRVNKDTGGTTSITSFWCFYCQLLTCFSPFFVVLLLLTLSIYSFILLLLVVLLLFILLLLLLLLSSSLLLLLFLGGGGSLFLSNLQDIRAFYVIILFQLLPDKYKIENNESSQKKIEDAKKVAAAGLEGKSKGMFTRERILESNAAV